MNWHPIFSSFLPIEPKGKQRSKEAHTHSLKSYCFCCLRKWNVHLILLRILPQHRLYRHEVPLLTVHHVHRHPSHHNPYRTIRCQKAMKLLKFQRPVVYYTKHWISFWQHVCQLQVPNPWLTMIPTIRPTRWWWWQHQQMDHTHRCLMIFLLKQRQRRVKQYHPIQYQHLKDVVVS